MLLQGGALDNINRQVKQPTMGEREISVMAAEKKKEQMEKNYRSRYDVNRKCYRRDKTHYVYEEWMETGKNKGYYIDHVFTVGKDGITLELLDYLQATDNGEVQNQEDDERNRELLAENWNAYVQSPEEELCGEEEPQSELCKEFNEKVRPHLSEEQMNFIYEYYGACKTLDEIAEELHGGEDGKTISRLTLLGRQKRIFAKVKEIMPQE